MCQYGVVVRWFGSNSLWIEPTGFDPRWERSLFFLFDDSFQMNESSFTHKENLKSETVGTIRSLPTLISKKRMALVWTTLKKYHDRWVILFLNFLLFSYTERKFISSNIEKDVLNLPKRDQSSVNLKVQKWLKPWLNLYLKSINSKRNSCFYHCKKLHSVL